MNNKIEKLIQEDLVNHSTNKGGYGYDWHNKMNSQQMSLVDILKLDRNDWDKAKKILPHQVQGVYDQLFSLYDETSILQHSFTQALKNPIIEDDEQSKENIKGIIQELNKAVEAFNNVAEELRKMQL